MHFFANVSILRTFLANGEEWHMFRHNRNLVSVSILGILSCAIVCVTVRPYVPR